MMPELPEVETIRRDLDNVLPGRTIIDVMVSKPKMIRGRCSSFVTHLKGLKIKKVNRRGKLLYVSFNNSGKFLLMHLKMTGQLIYTSQKKVISGGHNFPKIDKLPNKYSHIIFTFHDKSKLYFNDLRQFGYLSLVNEKQKQDVLEKFGIEPLTESFTIESFIDIFRKRKTAIKKILLNQNLIAGLGNIYVDEVCFFAGIRPTRRVNRITKKEFKKLYVGINNILKRAIKYRGTTFSDYRDSSGKQGNFSRFLKIYGRAGEECSRCHKGVAKKIRVGGRGTTYCPKCQT